MLRGVLVLLFAWMFAVAAAAGQQSRGATTRDDVVIPGGLLGARIRSIIETINANDPLTVQRFLERECAAGFRGSETTDRHIDTFLNLYRQWGGVDFHAVRLYTPPRGSETVVILRDRHFGDWRALVLRLNQASDSLVSGLQFTNARTPAEVQEPTLSEQEFLQRVDEAVKRLCRNDVFSGALLVARDDEVLFTRACGEANKSFHVANSIDTKFNLGSMNKMFTATAVAQLVERGVLSFQDTVAKYIDESWLPENVTGRITIHHLLSHTSGLGNYFNSTFWRSSRELYRSVKDFKPLVQGDRPAFEPGERFQYSNTGMLLLGVVIESATGESYFDYVRDHIYDPAGMRGSDSYDLDQPVPNLAVGYIPARDNEYGWTNNTYQHVIKGGPAGGGYSTVIDLHRFARALLTGKLVSHEMLDTLWTDYSGEYYGYGFVVEDGPVGKVIGHSGGFPGLNGNLDVFVDAGYIVAVLANYDQAANPLARYIKKMIERVGS